jgi:hypothetical protein
MTSPGAAQALVDRQNDAAQAAVGHTPLGTAQATISQIHPGAA